MSMIDNNGDTAPQKKTPGRPRSSSPRAKTFVFRANEIEAAAITAAAFAVRLPVAIYLRRRGLGLAITVPPPIADVQTAAALAAIGNNLNQAVRLMHEGRATEWPADQMDELRNLCTDLAGRIALSSDRR